MSLTDSTAAQTATTRRWLSIVGVGEDGIDGLNTTARESIQSAAVVFGGARHLALVAPLIRGAARPWASPFQRNVGEIVAHRGQAVCVLASGDPFQYGVGSVLSAHVAAEETTVVPGPSAFSLAASRLLWSLPQTILLSLCGRPIDLVRPHLHNAARLLVLTSDDKTPASLACLLSSLGFGASRIFVLEALGGPRERIRESSASAFDLDGIDPLHTLAIEVAAEPGARILPRAVGLNDELFEHDGQITKREVRALTLSALAPRRGELLWDVGAGAGSIAIEWLLSDPSLRSVAIEVQPERAARIRRNAAAFGVPHLEVIEGPAPTALEQLPMPDVAFIGGGANTPGLIDFVRGALRPNGRLVVNAVTLETEALIVHQQAQFGGSLMRIEVSRAGPIGGEQARMSAWRPALPVVQWHWVKP
ncbi:MAG TPA: precorrin-6y C5,15-methyltransferase (decarboxylating) subunit CbiE [Steroidobacteraceae bacterium]|jgi:precorrin-6Y C5,15-methyltransferase (decarboxylating)